MHLSCRGTNNKPANGGSTSKTTTLATNNAPLAAPIAGSAAASSVKSALKRPRDEAFGAEPADISAGLPIGARGKVGSSGDLKGRVSFEEAGANASADKVCVFVVLLDVFLCFDWSSIIAIAHYEGIVRSGDTQYIPTQ